MRKRKRAVKPLGVMENNAEGNDGNVNVNVNVNGDANANADAAGNEMLRNTAGTENGRDGEFDAMRRARNIVLAGQLRATSNQQQVQLIHRSARLGSTRPVLLSLSLSLIHCVAFLPKRMSRMI
eukprot:jgi/Psemu1/5459/gm1.5459_g